MSEVIESHKDQLSVDVTGPLVSAEKSTAYIAESDRKSKFNISNIAAISIALCALFASLWQGYTIKDTEIKQLRAYLTIPTGSKDNAGDAIGIVPVKSNEPLNAWVAFSNEGQTPAFKFKQGIAVKVLRYPLPINYNYAVDFTGDITSIGPHRTVYASKHADLALSPQEVSALTSGASAVYVYGMATYSDIFGNKHFTNFCIFLRFPAQNSNFCERHNDTDDSQDDER